MNAWGIPDWQDAAAYGDVTGWTFNRWRWEFYRRRDDLRECFDAHAEETYHHWQKFAGKPGFPAAHLRPHEPGFAAIVGEENVARFGYANLPNPRIGHQTWELLSPRITDDALKGVPLGGGANGKNGVAHLLEIAGLEPTPEQADFLRAHLSPVPPLEDNEFTVAFDLNRPLEPQIKTAQRTLKFHQEERHGRKLQKRRHPARWLAYLRVLDARASNASWSEIANLFYRQGVLDRRKNPLGGYMGPPPQAARDMWDAADALRTNF
jgi:hypothetical protein